MNPPTNHCPLCGICFLGTTAAYKDTLDRWYKALAAAKKDGAREATQLILALARKIS